MPWGLTDDDTYWEYFTKPIITAVTFDDEKDKNVNAEARDMIKRVMMGFVLSVKIILDDAYSSQMLKYEPDKRLTIEEIKNHAYFKSFDWKDLENRKSINEKGVGHEKQVIEKEKLAFIPAALPYKAGEDPYPCFGWVSPSLEVRDSPAKSEHGGGSLGGCWNALARKVKNWWRSR